MTVFCVEYFYAKPSFSEKLYSALERLVEPSRAENGCIQYDLLSLLMVKTSVFQKEKL